MNILFPDSLVVLNRRKIERDRVFILKEEMLRSSTGLSRFMDGLGAWMISNGKKLHEKYAACRQARPVARLQDSSNIFRTQTQL